MSLREVAFAAAGHIWPRVLVPWTVCVWTREQTVGGLHTRTWKLSSPSLGELLVSAVHVPLWVKKEEEENI